MLRTYLHELPALPQFGFKRSSTNNYVSTFLTKTPERIFSSPSSSVHPLTMFKEQHPASIFELRYRLFKTTEMPRSTTSLRGDQEPPTEEYAYTSPGPKSQTK